MNIHDFNSDPANIPVDATIRYPRTIGDEAAEFSVELQEETNVMGRVRHEPLAVPTTYDHDAVATVHSPKTVRTPEDERAELEADMIDDDRWAAYTPEQRTRRGRTAKILGKIVRGQP